MSAIVLDNSVLVAWVLGEPNNLVERVLDELATATGHVPAVWPYEFANVLVVAQRRQRISASQAARAVALVRGLNLAVEPLEAARTLEHVAELALAHGLTAYDAAYLDLAMRLGAGLATMDTALARAARTSGVAVRTLDSAA